MNHRKNSISAAIAAIGIATLIMDSRTAISGASEGIRLCLQVVVPSIFPFLVLSPVLTGALFGWQPKVLRPIRHLCKMPAGGESILLVGLLSGYPVGAQVIYQAYQGDTLSKSAAQRLLGFCNNAGPAFIFGMCGTLFTNPLCPWALWAIQIISAVATGMLLPGNHTEEHCVVAEKSLSFGQALSQAVTTALSICGWIVLFKTAFAFLDRWVLFLFPNTLSMIITGFLELANGINALRCVNSEVLRFIVCATILGFGGVCVASQTMSVTKDLGLGLYFPGKALQTLLAFSLAAILQNILFTHAGSRLFCYIGICLLLTVVISKVMANIKEKSSSILGAHHI